MLDGIFPFRYNKNDSKTHSIATDFKIERIIFVRILKVKCLAPTRLDNYLMQQFSALNPGRLNKALRENKIKLNGKNSRSPPA